MDCAALPRSCRPYQLTGSLVRFIQAAIANHSCDPNMTKQFASDGRVVRLFTNREVAAGEVTRQLPPPTYHENPTGADTIVLVKG